MQKRKYKRITEKEFLQVKGLLEYGLPVPDVARLTGRAKGTIYTLKQYPTYEAYRDYTTSRVVAKRTKKTSVVFKEEPEKKPVTATSITASIDKLTEAVYKLVDAWNTKPVKRSLF